MKQNLSKLEQNAGKSAELLKTLSHPVRLMTLCCIGEDEKPVNDIVDFTGVSQSSVSQHLSKLKAGGILESRKEANQVYYRIKDPKVLILMKAIQDTYCS